VREQRGRAHISLEGGEDVNAQEKNRDGAASKCLHTNWSELFSG